MNELRVHVIETGRLVGNQTFLRGDGLRSLLRPRRDVEFPALSFVIEHPEGLLAIDTGMGAMARSPRPRTQRRFVPDPRPRVGMGPAMRAKGLDPADVRRVVLTHLDWDHAGGLAHFPAAQVLLHRPERDFGATLPGRWRYEPGSWPSDFKPLVYDLDPEPYGPFPASKAITDDGSVRIVPLPGHSIGQVGVIVRSGDLRILFAADHILRQDWFVEDYDAGRLLGMGAFHPKEARQTSRRIHEFVESVPTVLVPSHDEEVPARLGAMEPLEIPTAGGRSAAPRTVEATA